MAQINVTNLTSTSMTNPNIDDLSCGSSAASNLTDCKSSGLGLRLSTPILMLSAGLLGNILALVVLYTSKKEVKSTVFFILLAGLAWTDLLGQTLTGPIAIAVYANNFQWVGGKPLCIYHAICMVTFGFLTPLLVCAMSLERVLALRFTYFYSRNVNRRKAIITVIGCWVFVLFFCTWPLMGFGSFELQFPGSWCFLNFHRESSNDIAYAAIYASLSLTFIIINIICNAAVVFTLLQMRNKRKLNNSPSIQRQHSAKKSHSKSSKPATETYMVTFLCAITLVFSTCYIPLNVNILMNQITGHKNIKLDLLGVRFASINQILDPWLYILLRKAFLFKVFKHAKKWICDKSRQITSKKYSKGSNSAQKNDYSMDQVPSFRINMVVDRLDGAESDSSEGSDQSLSSTSHLLPNNVSPGTKETQPRPQLLRSFSDTARRESERCNSLCSAGSDDSGVFNEIRTDNVFIQINNRTQNLSKSEKCPHVKRDSDVPRRLTRLSSSPAITVFPVLRRQSNT